MNIYDKPIKKDNLTKESLEKHKGKEISIENLAKMEKLI